MLSVCSEAVLVFSEVLEGREGVRPPNMEDELDSAGEDEATSLNPTHPGILISPVGHIEHVGDGLLVELVARHELAAVLGRGHPVLLQQVAGDRVPVPGNVLVTHLAGVLHILMDGDTQPFDLICFRLWF